MTKIRVFLFLLTVLVVGTLGAFIGLYAKGYRFNRELLKFSANGLLVIKSEPGGAQIYVNGELQSATNATIPLAPGTYDVSIRKDGYIEWNKRMEIEKEVVTEVTSHLFKSAPSLTAITFSGISSAIHSPDMSKIAFIFISKPVNNTEEEESEGLWIIETSDLPIGFSRDPRRITDGNLKDATLIWSPDGREILLDTNISTFLLDSSKFTPQSQLVNISSTKEDILAKWEEEREKILSAQLKKTPDELKSILERKAKSISFSPDEDMVLYIASGSATIPPDLIKQLPGSSTQKQEREIKENHTYVYDIKEDRNFLISEAKDISIAPSYFSSITSTATWFSTSRHVVLAEPNSVIIMDYDGTNRHAVYEGSYVSPFAYPTLSTDRLLILTNLGANSSPPNLYSLSLK